MLFRRALRAGVTLILSGGSLGERRFRFCRGPSVLALIDVAVGGLQSDSYLKPRRPKTDFFKSAVPRDQKYDDDPFEALVVQLIKTTSGRGMTPNCASQPSTTMTVSAPEIDALTYTANPAGGVQMV